MERRDSNGAATSSGILGACAGEQRARQNARRGLSALRPIDGEEVSARYRNQSPAREEICNQPPHRDQLAKKGCPFGKGQWQVLDWMFLRPYLPRGAKQKFSYQFQRRFARYLRFVRGTHIGSPERILATFRAQVCVSPM